MQRRVTVKFMTLILMRKSHGTNPSLETDSGIWGMYLIKSTENYIKNI